MSLNLEIVGTNHQIGILDRGENTVRKIGEILPLVIARYGIDPIDRDLEVLPEPEPVMVG